MTAIEQKHVELLIEHFRVPYHSAARRRIDRKLDALERAHPELRHEWVAPVDRWKVTA